MLTYRYCIPSTVLGPSNMQKILKKFSNHKDIYGFLWSLHCVTPSYTKFSQPIFEFSQPFFHENKIFKLGFWAHFFSGHLQCVENGIY